jgi:2-polyprenyl-6-methoxyphenol hydroxylase-like FAD-dependent oxidoreductase
MYELGILNEFLKRPHQEVTELGGKVGQDPVMVADFTHLPTHCRFLALMPQWDFLDFITEHGRRYPTFHLKMQAEVTDLIEESNAVVGVGARTPQGSLEIRAPLTIGADGRHSVVRERAGLQVEDLGAPMDVMWMRISRHPLTRDKRLAMLTEAGFLCCSIARLMGSALLSSQKVQPTRSNEEDWNLSTMKSRFWRHF